MSGTKVRTNFSWRGLHEHRCCPLVLSESSSSCLDHTTLQMPSVPHGCMMMQNFPVTSNESRKEVVTAGVGGLNYRTPMELWSTHGYMYPTFQHRAYARGLPAGIMSTSRLDILPGVQTTRYTRLLCRTLL